MKILVIEDVKAIREEIVDILRFEDFEAQGAANGIEGVQLAKKHVPDLVVCDIMMPELDGYGVLRELRNDPSTRAIPFIFLTAKSTRADTREGMDLGADDYLTKPFTAEELLSAISTRLERRKVVTLEYTEEIIRTRQQLDYATYYDSLTGLPNRLLLGEVLESTIKAIPEDRLAGLLLIDLDQFRYINGALGRDCGDLVLKKVAERIGGCFRKSDFVSRVIADQFAVLLSDFAETRNAAKSAAKILQVTRKPIKYGEHMLHITASIGISLYPVDTREAQNFVPFAETAMYLAKEQGRNKYQFYDPSRKVRAVDRLALENGLYTALENREFSVHYQPQVDLKTGAIIGVEALIRWQHPEFGPISPELFIPVAEETGLIVEIGKWVLETVCFQNKAWQDEGCPPVRASVNISGLQLEQQDIAKTVSRALKKSGLSAEYLELEITERVIMKDAEATITTLKQLKEKGVSLSIDDFGTGYSSLAYLKKLPIDTLKVDKSFVQDIATDSDSAAITAAVIEMAHSLGLMVIAEGVMDNEQKAFLRAHGCDAMQGFLFSQAVPPEELKKLLMDKRSG